MRNKFVNLFLREPEYGIRLVFICVAVIVIVLLYKKARTENARLEKIKIEKHLIAQAPEMEEKLKALELSRRIMQSAQKAKKISVTIDGVVIQNNAPFVMIGEDMFAQGDSIDGYTIYEITLDSVILEDKATKSRYTITLPSGS